MNYKWIMEVVMADCPKGWSISTTNAVPVGAPGLGFTSGVWKICSAKINALVPEGIDYLTLPAACPAGSVDSPNTAATWGAGATCLASSSCKSCRTVTAGLFPSWSEIIMTACPAGWKSSTNILPISGGTSGACSKNPAFASVSGALPAGYIPCKLCIAP